MSVLELAALAEIVGALAVLVTLIFLTVQMRQNTKALTAATFQEISTSMGHTAEVIAAHPDLAELFIKGAADSSELTQAERLRFRFGLLMTFRRFEAVYMQRMFGAVNLDLTQGFERSAASAIKSPGGLEWWAITKPGFSTEFVAHVDGLLALEDTPDLFPDMNQQTSAASNQSE
jgi:hypothetical protein